jgi:hypothetical protein
MYDGNDDGTAALGLFFIPLSIIKNDKDKPYPRGYFFVKNKKSNV